MSKYAVISSAVFDTDEVAQSISADPRRFLVNETGYVILSLDLEAIDNLITYVQTLGVGVEFEFIQGSGNVSILTHNQAIDLMSLYGQSVE